MDIIEQIVRITTDGEETRAEVIGEVKHGEWVWQGSISEGCWVCSECKYQFYQIYGHENYCPHCGAKMDGKEAEDGT